MSQKRSSYQSLDGNPPNVQLMGRKKQSMMAQNYNSE